MRFLPILVLFLSVNLNSLVHAQALADDLLDLRVDVVYLSSDYLEGRLSGTKGEAMAAAYIANRYREIGLTGRGDSSSFFQYFPFREMSNPHAAASENAIKGTAINVVGFLDNKAPSTVIIGAHYDHLGMGGSGSLHAGEPAIHNGADDNASGVAAMLRLAEKLKQSKLTNNNYLFIAFSAEELGLFGSKYFAEHPSIDLPTSNYMINMDMVGRLNDEKVLAISGVGTSPFFRDLLTSIEVDGIQPKLDDSGIGPSDHTSFYLKDIPVLHFFTGQHKQYHKPEDDAHLINFEGIRSVSDFIYTIIEKMNSKGKSPFVKTKQKEEKKASKFKVTLGVMPDYVYSGQGMKIDGVLEDRPAQKAGLEDGDVVIRIGDVVVKDIYDYMEGLSKFKVGDTAKVTVVRGEETITKDVVF